MVKVIRFGEPHPKEDQFPSRPKSLTFCYFCTSRQGTVPNKSTLRSLIPKPQDINLYLDLAPHNMFHVGYVSVALDPSKAGTASRANRVRVAERCLL